MIAGQYNSPGFVAHSLVALPTNEEVRYAKLTQWVFSAGTALQTSDRADANDSKSRLLACLASALVLPAATVQGTSAADEQFVALNRRNNNE